MKWHATIFSLELKKIFRFPLPQKIFVKLAENHFLKKIETAIWPNNLIMNIFHKNTETPKQYVTIIAVIAGVFRTKKMYIHSYNDEGSPADVEWNDIFLFIGMDYAVLTDLIYLWLQIKLANIFIKQPTNLSIAQHRTASMASEHCNTVTLRITYKPLPNPEAFNGEIFRTTVDRHGIHASSIHV